MANHNNTEHAPVLKAFLTLLESYGGCFDLQLLSSKLNKSEDEVLSDIDNNKFFALRLTDQILIPAFQFTAFKPLPHLSEVLNNMKGVDSWQKVVFFVTELGKLNDYPAHILKKNPTEDDIDVIIKAASNLSQTNFLETVIQ